MQHDGKPAGQRHLGFPHAGAPGHLASPGLQLRRLRRPRQHDVRRLIENAAHLLVADLGDPPGDVGLSGLILLLGEAEVCARPLGGPEALRIVDRRRVGQRHDRAHRRGGHQQPGAGVPPRHGADLAVQGGELTCQHRADLQQGRGHQLQGRMVGRQLADPALEGLGRRLAHLQAKAAQDPP